MNTLHPTNHQLEHQTGLLLQENHGQGTILSAEDSKQIESHLVPSPSMMIHPSHLPALVSLRDANPSLALKLKSRSSSLTAASIPMVIKEESSLYWNGADMGEIITLNNEGKVTCLNLGGKMMRLKTLGSFLLHCGNTCRVMNLGGTDIFLSEWKRAVQEATAKEVNLVLEKLHMGGNGIGGSGQDVLNLMETIPFFKEMCVLDLRYNDLTPDHISKVADFVICNPKCSIQVLYLEGNNIQCRGCQAIGDLLRHSTSLIELYLGANRIGVEGARALALGLNKNAILRKLYLEGNMIGAEGADRRFGNHQKIVKCCITFTLKAMISTK